MAKIIQMAISAIRYGYSPTLLIHSGDVPRTSSVNASGSGIREGGFGTASIYVPGLQFARMFVLIRSNERHRRPRLRPAAGRDHASLPGAVAAAAAHRALHPRAPAG